MKPSDDIAEHPFTSPCASMPMVMMPPPQPPGCAPWVRPPPWQKARDAKGLPPCYVADGAFPFRSPAGELCLLFSSWNETNYATGIARSTSGELAGPWTCDATAFFPDNGGHAMIFAGFDGQIYLALHQPNDPPPEHPRFIAFNLGRPMLTPS